MRNLTHISKILLILTIVFGVGEITVPQTVYAQTIEEIRNACLEKHGAGTKEFVNCVQEATKLQPGDPAFSIFNWALEKLANVMLTLASYLSGLAGIILNGVIYHTIVNISQNYANINSIASTWKVVRDIANMVFIFVLLYAAIKTIIGAGQGTKELIVKVIVVAVLINFSLFFTRVVIDISNVFALTFYDAIAPNALSVDNTNWQQQAGLSNAFMQHMNLQSLWNSPDLNGASILTIGIMGTIMLLIAAFSFFAIAIMFIIRYVILILVLVLSPIAFIAYVLPSGSDIEKYRKQWLDALLGQSFFAPIYFMLTWVTLSILSGITSSFGLKPEENVQNVRESLGGIASVVGGTLDSGAFIMFINFFIVIILLITSLMVAKDWANKAPYGVNNLTKWAAGAAGGATVGLAGWAGRNSLGRLAEKRSNNQDLKDRAAAGSRWAQLQLYGARKTAGSSFDMRATKVGDATIGSLGGGKGAGKGGFTEFKKKKAEGEAKYATSLAPGDEVVDQAEQKLKEARATDINASSFKFERENAIRDQERETRIKNAERQKAELDYQEYMERLEKRKADNPGRPVEDVNQTKRFRDAMEKARRKATEASRDLGGMRTNEGYKQVKISRAQRQVDRLNGYDDDRAKEILRERGISNPSKQDIARVKKEGQGAGSERKKAYADSVQNSWIAWGRGYNNAAAAQIRKGKSKEKKLAEAAKAFTEEQEEGGDTTTTPPAPPTPPPAPAGPATP